MHRKSNLWRRLKALIVSSVVAGATLVATASFSSQSVSYDFNTAGELSSEFDSYVGSGTAVQSSTGGIGNSGAISTNGGSANAVFASKDSYSLGAEGSVYTFTSFLQSVGNSGYSGMGFTSLTPSAANASGSPFRPTDALGISVHGGGFVFHNGGTNYGGSWGSDNSGITTIKKSTINDLLNNGSPSDWYFAKLVITRIAGDEFKMRIEIWSANADGSLIRSSEADAIFEISNLENNTILTAPAIKSYVNFSGLRVYYFDNFEVTLVGSTVIQEGAPVVLTSGATNTDGVVALAGSVSSDGGASVTERGFVYGTSSNPTTSDTKLVVSGTTGSMAGSTPALASGTYFFRAFATNSTGTSYGENLSAVITTTSAGSGDSDEGAGSGDSDEGVAAPNPIVPRLDSIWPQRVRPGHEVAILGKRLSCTASVSMYGHILEPTHSWLTPQLEELKFTIPAGIPVGSLSFELQTCWGSVVATGMLEGTRKPISVTYLQTKPLDTEETISDIRNVAELVGDEFRKVHCIVNSQLSEEEKVSMALEICSNALHHLPSGSQMLTSSRDSYGGSGTWVRVWFGN